MCSSVTPKVLLRKLYTLCNAPFIFKGHKSLENTTYYFPVTYAFTWSRERFSGNHSWSTILKYPELLLGEWSVQPSIIAYDIINLNKHRSMCKSGFKEPLNVRPSMLKRYSWFIYLKIILIFASIQIAQIAAKFLFAYHQLNLKPKTFIKMYILGKLLFISFWRKKSKPNCI